MLSISDVTVLLSLTMFLNQVSDTMPKTSDAVPLISMINNKNTNCPPLRLKIITLLDLLTKAHFFNTDIFATLILILLVYKCLLWLFSLGRLSMFNYRQSATVSLQLMDNFPISLFSNTAIAQGGWMSVGHIQLSGTIIVLIHFHADSLFAKNELFGSSYIHELFLSEANIWSNFSQLTIAGIFQTWLFYSP